MTLIKGYIAKPRPILGIRDLVRADMEELKGERRTPAVDRFKDPHHRIARMFASGMRTRDVHAASGYSYMRITSLYADPAFQELIAHYRNLVDEAWVETQEDFYTLATSNMVRAEKHVAQRLDEAEEAGEAIPIKDALAISRDAADRFGYGKKSQVTNVNIDFASQLERAIKRSGKTIDAQVENPRLPGPPQPTQSPKAPTSLGSHPIASEESVSLVPSRPREPNTQIPRSHPFLEPIRRRA